MVTKIVQISEIEANTLFNEFAELKQYFDRYEKLIDLPKDKYLTRKEVAKLLSITLVTVHEWTKKNILISYKIANRVYYKQSEINKAFTKVVNPEL